MSEPQKNATDLDVAEAMYGAVKEVGGNVLIFRAEGILFSEHCDHLRADIQSQVGDSHRVVVIPAGVNVVDAGLNDRVLAELRAIRESLEGNTKPLRVEIADRNSLVPHAVEKVGQACPCGKGPFTFAPLGSAELMRFCRAMPARCDPQDLEPAGASPARSLRLSETAASSADESSAAVTRHSQV